MRRSRDRVIALLFLTSTTAGGAYLSGGCTFSSTGQGGPAAEPEGSGEGGAGSASDGSPGGTGPFSDDGGSGSDSSPPCPPGSTAPGCNPGGSCSLATCPSGCCDGMGRCQSGTNNLACGSGALPCAVCNPPSSCNAQTCVSSCGPTSCGGCCDPNGLCVSGAQDNACGSGGNLCVACTAPQTCGGGGTGQACGGGGTSGCMLPDGGTLNLAGTWIGSSSSPGGGTVQANLVLSPSGGNTYSANLTLNPSQRGAGCPGTGGISSKLTVTQAPSGPGQCRLAGSAPPVGTYASSIDMTATQTTLTGTASPACSAPSFQGTLAH